jgi:hypothetical protein
MTYIRHTGAQEMGQWFYDIIIISLIWPQTSLWTIQADDIDTESWSRLCISNQKSTCVISDLRRGINEIFALLWSYAA